MNAAILAGLHRLPQDIDLIVGIPRSGLLAANMISLAATVPMTDLDSFLAGRIHSSGFTKRRIFGRPRDIADMRKILIVDDSIRTGTAMRSARKRVSATHQRRDFIHAAIYGADDRHAEVDLIFQTVPQPRLFQWNVMQHVFLEQSCVDIDGVLCADPRPEENDDGPAYSRFLRDATPLLRPARKIAYLVTSRLERHRAATEAWLAKHGIRYGKLMMLNLATKEERQRTGAHAAFKAEFYRRSNTILFIESEEHQARDIAQLSGKSVLCVQTQRMFEGVQSLVSKSEAQVVSASPLKRSPAGAETSFKRLDGAAQDPNIAYILEDAANEARSRTLISYLGPVDGNFVDVIEAVAKACRDKDELPVVVLSQFNLGAMIPVDIPVEFVPEMQHVKVLASDIYARYASSRWALILEKWNIDREVTLALDFSEFLASQTHHPEAMLVATRP